MNFEEWWEQFSAEHEDWRYADSEALRKAAFKAGAASRDAEVARLKTVPMKYRRMEFNAQLQKENDQLREQVALLRGALRDCAYDEGGFCINPDAAKALAATEPKITKPT